MLNRAMVIDTQSVLTHILGRGRCLYLLALYNSNWFGDDKSWTVFFSSHLSKVIYSISKTVRKYSNFINIIFHLNYHLLLKRKKKLSDVATCRASYCVPIPTTMILARKRPYNSQLNISALDRVVRMGE